MKHEEFVAREFKINSFIKSFSGIKFDILIFIYEILK